MDLEQAKEELLLQLRTGSFQKIVVAIEGLIDAKLNPPKPAFKRCSCGEMEMVTDMSSPFFGEQHFIHKPCVRRSVTENASEP